MSTAGWSIPIDKLAERANARMEDMSRKIIFETFKAVVLRSPVDTGRFRANWNVSVGAPNYSTTDSKDQSLGLKQVNGVNILPIIGKVVCLSNGLPYGLRLENGWSKQAPQGMIKLTMAEITQHVKEALA